MLKLTIQGAEFFDESTGTFTNTKTQQIVMEHSLVSISKWEAKHQKPFLVDDNTKNKSSEEILDYYRLMTITQNVDPNLYLGITRDQILLIDQYINSSRSATFFSNQRNQNGSPKHLNSEVITSELIYYWMIAMQIPFEAQRWHLNRLLTLIQICSIKNSPPKKMSKEEIYSRNRALNEARKRKLNTKG